MNQNQEFWKQFAGSIARKFLTLLAGFLIARWSVPQEITNYLTNDATVAVVAGFFILAVGVLWTWAKTKFNINFVGAAHEAPASVSLRTVKEVAKEQASFQSTI